MRRWRPVNRHDHLIVARRIVHRSIAIDHNRERRSHFSTSGLLAALAALAAARCPLRTASAAAADEVSVAFPSLSCFVPGSLSPNLSRLPFTVSATAAA